MASAPATSSALTQFVLKVHSRCDLACDYCYVYEHADQSWRRRPQVIAAPTVERVAARIAEHAATHGLARVRVVLHGGEPLLVGAPRLREIAKRLRGAVEPVARLDLRMQSNGVLLTPQLCEVLLDCDIRVGISLDGDQVSNDRHRRYANGASSHPAVLRALALLRRPEHRRVYGGILCTVDIDNDAIAVYESLMAQEPPRVDFLLPHATWERPPPGMAAGGTPYADWLLRVFRRWRGDGRPVPIRIFDAVLATARGGPSGTEALGLGDVDLAVIETDGSWEQVDSLKITYDGGAATGLDVFAHSADDVAGLPVIARRRTGIAGLCDTCRACPVVRQCGGGLFAHRFREANGFDNPSVYCSDLKELILGINEQRSWRPAPAAPPSDLVELGLATFDAVGAGYGDEAAVTRLAELQLGITRTLVAAVADSARVMGWQLLLDVERAAPSAVAAVLRHPYVRAWAVDCLGATGGRPDFLNNVAAACAVRGGVEAELPVPVIQGAAYLPSLGVLDLPGSRSETAVVSVAAGAVRLRDDHHGVWVPTASADLGGRAVAIEDSDPHRDRHEWAPSGRLDEVARDVWRRSVAAAWRVVQADAPSHAAGLAAGLRLVTPLVPTGDAAYQGSSSRHAFGAVAATPSSPDALAVMLVHEFQHGKLWALLDLVDLVDGSHPAQLTVGWRPDPRPVEAVLQGVYAHLAVADIWRVRAQRDPAAAGTFRQYRDWTSAALDSVVGTGALTPAGARLVELMGATIGGWQ